MLGYQVSEKKEETVDEPVERLRNPQGPKPEEGASMSELNL